VPYRGRALWETARVKTTLRSHRAARTTRCHSPRRTDRYPSSYRPRQRQRFRLPTRRGRQEVAPGLRRRLSRFVREVTIHHLRLAKFCGTYQWTIPTWRGRFYSFGRSRPESHFPERWAVSTGGWRILWFSLVDMSTQRNGTTLAGYLRDICFCIFRCLCPSGWPTLPLLEGRGFGFFFFFLSTMSVEKNFQSERKTSNPPTP